MHETRDVPKPFEKDLFPPLHATSFGVASLMVVSAEVENAVDHQGDEFLIEGPPRFFSLTHRRRNGNHHVAQLPRTQVHAMRQTGFPRGECQDVRRAILIPKPVVQSTHMPIADEGQSQFGRRLPDL